MVIDTHCHIHFDAFDNDRDDVIRRSFDSGVKKIICVGCDEKTSLDAIDLAKKYENIFATVGFHPNTCDTLTQRPEEVGEMLENMIQKNKPVAIGETGVDTYRDGNLVKQIPYLDMHIHIAKKYNLPVILHIRGDEHKEVLEALKRYDYYHAVIHCCSLEKEILKPFWEKGIFTSFTGIVTYPSAGDILESAITAPISQIMIETDAPYLAPQKHRGKRNEPSYIIDIAKMIAEKRNMNYEDFVEKTTQNAEEFFKI
jgi:TatD DNase family protein